MATSWQAVSVEQAEVMATRLRQLASSGLHFLNNEFGIDLGLKPELYPSWVILSTALFGMIAAVALSWVAACHGVGRRKRGAVVSESGASVTDIAKAPLKKSVKSEEPKKKNKKKPADKQKTQQNGRTVPEQREEIKAVKEIPKESPPQPPADVKADKAKKSKKKPKPEVKQNQGVSCTDGKEPDEGAWETKISNREKRQQRRKEKGPGDNSGSPGGSNHVTQQIEQPLVAAPVSTKKNKESLNSKAGKADAIITPAPTNWNAVRPVNSGGWTEMSVKPPSKVSASDCQKWSVDMKTSGHRNSEPLAWGQDSEGGTWTGMDGRIKTDLNPLSFPMLGLKQSAGEPVTQASADIGKWDRIATVDEWSGFNGLGAVDPSSDWNAPAELWGNYEEPKAETLVPKETPVSQPSRLQESDDDDDDKEKEDPSGSSKSKRKKKKKKKPEDENVLSHVTIEGLIKPTESIAIKPCPHVPLEEPVKQNATPLSSQKKPDQNWEPVKQVQRKKARRET
ncbi:metadherin a isoform X1 [Electrophorus electricus]|uniref:metadherin a isoform X1 n=1 Tax=Electrophorus electricus TaxID=8005 RepID=UPI0015D03B36|nr:metadherin a isoform X1 [Electrophorus electricus]